jgi:hypothetical protein
MAPVETSRLPWPLYTIDFEASSLEPGGYPIEVGIALWPLLNEPIFGWSSLIRPTDDWLQHGDWSRASREVHGIRQSELIASGQPPLEVTRAINEALAQSGIVWCDGGRYDAQWAHSLFKAASLKFAVPLGNWGILINMLGSTARDRAHQWRERTPAKHRAREDAEHLLLELAYAVGVEVGPPQRLDLRVPALIARRDAATGDPEHDPKTGRGSQL